MAATSSKMDAGGVDGASTLIDAHGRTMEFKIKRNRGEDRDEPLGAHYCEVHGFTPRASGDFSCQLI